LEILHDSFGIVRLWNGGAIKMNASPKLNVDMSLMFQNVGFVKAFTDSTMVNHHEKPQFGDVFLIVSKHFKQIQTDNTPLNLKWNLRISPWNRRLLWKPPLSGSMLNFRGVDHGIIRNLNHQ